MTYFKPRLINRLEMPEKHVLVLEDDLQNQSAICLYFARLFGHQGKVQVSVVSGSMLGSMLFYCSDLVLLDHDMPSGNGIDLLEYAAARRRAGNSEPWPPVITFSGIPSNNDALMAAGADYKFTKGEVLEGRADDLIRRLLFP